MYDINQNGRLINYVKKVIDDAFKNIGKENDAKLSIVILGDKDEIYTCLVFLESKANYTLYNRVAYRLAGNFKNHFPDLDIKFYPRARDFLQSDQTSDMDNNGNYGLIPHPQDCCDYARIDLNNTVAYIHTKMFGGFTLSLFPWDNDSRYANCKLPDWSPDPMNSEYVSKRLAEYKGGFDKFGVYQGQEGWIRYANEIEAIFGVRPDYNLQCRVIFDAYCENEMKGSL